MELLADKGEPTQTMALVALIAATAAGLIFGVIATLFPARQASRMGIIQALRYE